MENRWLSSAVMAAVVVTLWGCTDAPGIEDLASPYFLYASLTGQDKIAAYNICAGTGILVPVGVYSTGHAPTSMALDESGTRLYVSNYQGSSISAYSINQADGSLENLAGSPYRTEPECWDIALSPARGCIYGLHYNSSLISVRAIDAATGALSPVNGSPFSIAYACCWAMAVDPAGKFCYLTHGTGSSLAIYPINPVTGGLSLTSNELYAVDRPQGLAFDQAGKFLYMADADNLEAFQVDAATGGIAALKGSSIPAPGFEVALDRFGRFVYVSNSGDDSVSGYRIDPGTGALAVIKGSPFRAGDQPWGIVVDPTGRFVYAANFQGKSITGYFICQDTGALVEMAGFPVVDKAQPMNLVIAEISHQEN